VKTLLDAGADVNMKARDDKQQEACDVHGIFYHHTIGMTPLFFANHEDMMLLLLGQGADPHVYDELGRNFIHYLFERFYPSSISVDSSEYNMIYLGRPIWMCQLVQTVREYENKPTFCEGDLLWWLGACILDTIALCHSYQVLGFSNRLVGN
jgi:hypothetical protein